MPSLECFRSKGAQKYQLYFRNNLRDVGNNENVSKVVSAQYTIIPILESLNQKKFEMAIVKFFNLGNNPNNKFIFIMKRNRFAQGYQTFDL